MPTKLTLRKVPGWKFYNENVQLCDCIAVEGLSGLDPHDKKVAKLFISVFKGCKRLLDFGCGAGFPGLYVAKNVKQIVCIDSAPNMVSQAFEYSTGFEIKNVNFIIGGDKGLPFKKGQFDGIMMCGLLESMDWESVHIIMHETKRVLAPEGVLAILDSEWQGKSDDLLPGKLFVEKKEGNFEIQLVEEKNSPYTLIDKRFVVKPASPLFDRLNNELKNKVFGFLSINKEELNDANIIDAWYDESAQFDAKSLEELISSYKFADIKVQTISSIWDSVVFLTARKKCE